LVTDYRGWKIDMVITKSISRFARNTVTLLQTVREFKTLEVDIYFEEQNIHTMSGDGELMMTILASYAQEESHEAIVDEKTFQAVQGEKSRRSARFNKKSVPKKTYPFSSFMECDNCGKNYRRKVTKSGPVWVCNTFNSLGKSACASNQIPESILQQVTAEVLGKADFTGEQLHSQIQKTVVYSENVLIFCFRYGSEVTRKWEDRSRAESWTDEMKEAASQKVLGRNKHNA